MELYERERIPDLIETGVINHTIIIAAFSLTSTPGSHSGKMNQSDPYCRFIPTGATLPTPPPEVVKFTQNCRKYLLTAGKCRV